MEDSDNNTLVCPLCGQSNDCVVALCGASSKPCWCVAYEFPQSLLEQTSHLVRSKVCICKACVRNAKKITVKESND